MKITTIAETYQIRIGFVIPQYKYVYEYAANHVILIWGKNGILFCKRAENKHETNLGEPLEGQ